MNGNYYIKMKKTLLFLVGIVCLPLVVADSTFFDGDDGFIMGISGETQPPPSGGGGGGTLPSCKSLWLCDEWSSCNNNARQRTCIDLKGCNEDKPPLLTSCSTIIGKRIYGCVTFSELDKILVRWKVGILGFDVLNEGINKWKWGKEC